MASTYKIRAYNTKEEWLLARNKVNTDNFTISSTEAATVLNVNPFQTITDLYDIKLGLKRRPDISNKACVQYGVQSEDLIRKQAMIDLPYFELDYRPYDIYESVEYPFMIATLDGFLTIKTPDNPWGFEVGEVGLLEIKTGQLRSSEALRKVKEDIPINYYCQMLHAAKIIGASFVINPCRYKWDAYRDEQRGMPDIFCFYHLIDLRDPEIVKDQKSIIQTEKYFIQQYLVKKQRPNLVIKF